MVAVFARAFVANVAGGATVVVFAGGDENSAV
jgi:hypothetical protein